MPPVYHDCFMVEEFKESAKAQEIEDVKGWDVPTGSTYSPVKPATEWPTCQVVEQRSRTPYRTVFTMKRMITARPTQPHITPITMAVTSPAGERHKPDERLRDLNISHISQTVSLGRKNIPSYQEKAPSLILTNKR